MIKAIIFDWAGTTVDYGCFAPMQVFKQVFCERGIEITDREAREPMGMQKRDHIAAICSQERVSALWEEKYGHAPTENDIDELYAQFEPALFRILHQYGEPLEGVADMVLKLKDDGVKIGSTTGYTKEMMDVIVPVAKAHGYAPDCLVTPNEVPAGRPYPWMIYENMKHLGIDSKDEVMKIGDTVSDMQEGRHAGVWTVGVIEGSSELGLGKHEVESLNEEALNERKQEVHKRLIEHGAHLVINRITDVPQAIRHIEMLLATGGRA